MSLARDKNKVVITLVYLLAPLTSIRKAKAAFFSLLDLQENTNPLKKKNLLEEKYSHRIDMLKRHLKNNPELVARKH